MASKHTLKSFRPFTYSVCSWGTVHHTFDIYDGNKDLFASSTKSYTTRRAAAKAAAKLGLVNYKRVWPKIS